MHWIGNVPEKCQMCGDKVIDRFIDGATKLGPWAIMCKECHKRNGRGIGVGKGQRYQLMQGQWRKVKG